jgi:hypothetical protein
MSTLVVLSSRNNAYQIEKEFDWEQRRDWEYY